MSQANHHNHEREQLEEEAISWIVRLTSGKATEADRLAVQAWRGRSRAHQEAFEKIERIWGGVEVLRAPLTADGHHEEIGFIPSPTMASGRTARILPLQMRWHHVAIAASLAALAWIFMLQSHVLIQWQSDYYTETGEQSTFTLSDGSIVQLNTQAAVKIDFTEGMRRVTLLEGEASFQVVKDNLRPFVVHANGGMVRAVGTEFLVYSSDKGAVITVVEGVVEVSGEQQRNDTFPPTRLALGQEVRYGDELGIGPVKQVDLDVATAWQRGKLIFGATPLASVVREINRYRPGHITILNDSLKTHEVSGVFELDRLDDAIYSIEHTLPITSLHLGNRYIFFR